MRPSSANASKYLAELCDLHGNVDDAPGPFQLAVAALNLNGDRFLEALETLLFLLQAA